ncbi:hypothetical protein [Acanthopleuribacter pedis]|uniref:Uncharacterized protein n=1 Tax=Acanthopleuribacter pedis TaxID=442870 RepID=A0A8J7QFQ0_9BACT|nr:hypothetical protein [Acanthopleuribacter pedis]MBO1319676.1 hypothetical protein [Acanthopleuribacter pedis]
MSELNKQALEAASELVSYVGDTVVGINLELDENHQYQNNVLSFRFNPETNRLEVSHYVAAAGLPDDPPKLVQRFKMVDTALQDPAIGGMYEMDGGKVHLVEEKRVFEYTKEYDPLTISKQDFRKQFQYYLKIAQAWSDRWYLQVARITHGKREAPSAPVTLNNP